MKAFVQIFFITAYKYSSPACPAHLPAPMAGATSYGHNFSGSRPQQKPCPAPSCLPTVLQIVVEHSEEPLQMTLQGNTEPAGFYRGRQLGWAAQSCPVHNLNVAATLFPAKWHPCVAAKERRPIAAATGILCASQSSGSGYLSSNTGVRMFVAVGDTVSVFCV